MPELHDPSDTDQERLRRVADKIKAIMREEKLGGTLTLVSQQSAEWLMEVPEWAGVSFDNNQIKISISSRNAKHANETMHLIASIRDNSREYAEAFSRVFDMVKKRIAADGGSLDHVPNAGVGYGPSGKNSN